MVFSTQNRTYQSKQLQIIYVHKEMIDFINKVSFMFGKLLYLSVIGRPILYVLLLILRGIYLIKIFCLIFMIRNGMIIIPPKEPKFSLLSESDYIKEEIIKFKKRMNYFSEQKEKENQNKWNTNVDDIFYKTKEYNEAMITSPNDLEKKWKNRTIIEKTPQGNIIMFYDCYKRGFSYYSDQTNVTYSLLNAVAMKYVKIYLCMDLFVDNKIIKENISPIIKLRQEEEKEENKKKTKKFLNNSCFLKNKKGGSEKSLFSKVLQKKVNLPSQATEKPFNISKQKTEKTIDSINTFIYLGKIQNYSFLNLKEKCKKENREQMKISYSSYKKGDFNP